MEKDEFVFEDEELIQQDGPDLFALPGGPATEVAPPPSKLHGSRPQATPDAPLALYRRYRPDTFGEVIGQDHVTVPLMRALENNRVGHAYLFSGPRGCGKTTSARILARCLNCEQGPTATPCGQCQSCFDLATGGPGSIDVIEIDAASHGGVDDARELRERAFFAPVSSRYKVYIVDEAHMVTAGGFNALLKLVEEPPPHAKFIFATTEPEKVIGTIRSRTHHYPFRLVPPRTLGSYLEQICEAEGVKVDPMALPLVVRAGAGSVRDSLSVLDQLLGGAGDSGVRYEQAAALLGYTPEALLDDMMDAFAAGDAAGVFSTVDRVIEVGQDPRRFAEDLLRRLRDLVILAAVPSAIEDGILEVAGDQGERLRSQASALGTGELTRAAEVIAAGLTAMRGTTAPRLHLELMCARVLLPGADNDGRGIHARLDRLERTVGMNLSSSITTMRSLPRAAADEVAPVKGAKPEPERKHSADETTPVARTQHHTKAASTEPTESEQKHHHRPTNQPPNFSGSSSRTNRFQQRPAGTAPRNNSVSAKPAHPVAKDPGTPPVAAAPAGTMDVQALRRAWPSVLEAVKKLKRFSYMLISQNAQIQDYSDGVLTLAFASQGARDNFLSGGSQEILLEALGRAVGLRVRIQALVGGDSSPLSLSSGRSSAQPSATSAPVTFPEIDIDSTISEDDEEYDVQRSAAELITGELGGEIIPDEELQQST